MINMNNRRKRERFFFLVGVGVMSLITLIVLLGMFVLSKHSISKITEQNLLKVTALQEKIDELIGNQIEVLVVRENVLRGDTIEASNIELIEIDKRVVPINSVKSIEKLKNKKAKMDLKKGTILTSGLLMKKHIKDSSKEHELDMIHLMSNVQKGEVVDVRIMFATGQDYVVLSQKELINIDHETSTVWMNLTPIERLKLNSAVVDTYTLKGSKLYTVRYIEPYYQTVPLPDYPVNEYVRKRITEMPELVELVDIESMKSLRDALEIDLKAVEEAASSVDQQFRRENSNKPDSDFFNNENSHKAIEDNSGVKDFDIESNQETDGF